MSRLSAHPLPKDLLFFGLLILLIAPAHAFTANSLEITVGDSGDAVATFRFTLEGLLENAIPQSMLEEELVKGLTTSSEPPELMSMDRSSATILMKNFAGVNAVPEGTEYRTASMDFKKAEIALQESALSSVVSADFSPSQITVTFPDGYAREFYDSDTLPSITHVVTGSGSAPADGGTLEVTSSPDEARVYLDGEYMGKTPATLAGIPEGTHTVSIRKDGFDPAEQTVMVVVGETTRVSGYLSYSAVTPAPQGITYPIPGFTWAVAIIVLIGCLFIFRMRK